MVGFRSEEKWRMVPGRRVKISISADHDAPRICGVFAKPYMSVDPDQDMEERRLAR